MHLGIRSGSDEYSSREEAVAMHEMQGRERIGSVDRAAEEINKFETLLTHD